MYNLNDSERNKIIFNKNLEKFFGISNLPTNNIENIENNKKIF